MGLPFHRCPMQYLVIDTRFVAPVYVFLHSDPVTDKEFPGLPVRWVELEPSRDASAAFDTVAQHPKQPDTFRGFRSDAAALGAGFSPIEPRYVGATWAAYSRVFRYGARTVRVN